MTKEQKEEKMESIVLNLNGRLSLVILSNVVSGLGEFKDAGT